MNNYEVKIRNAAYHDLNIINDIYNYYVLHSTCTYQTEPDTIENRSVWFDQHNKDYPIIVAQIDHIVIGWASISKFRNREAYNPTVENSIYIRHDKLSNGIGAVLLEELIRLSKLIGYHSMVAGISFDQEISIKLHKKFGFEKVAHLKEVGYKFNKWLDVVYYQLLL